MLQDMYAENDKEKKQVQFEALKLTLKDKAIRLKVLKASKDNLELQASNLEKEIKEIESEIRNAWSPFVVGADKCSLNLGEVTLTLTPTTNVKMDDSEQATEWLVQNGYKDVMKWQIHNQTFKKIALEHYTKEEGGDLIPGCTYTNFNVIKVK